MKRKLSLLLAMVLAMTMVMGISVTAFAATRPDGTSLDEANDCPTHQGAEGVIHVYSLGRTFNKESVDYLECYVYDTNEGRVVKNLESTFDDDDGGAMELNMFPNGHSEGWYYLTSDFEYMPCVGSAAETFNSVSIDFKNSNVAGATWDSIKSKITITTAPTDSIEIIQDDSGISEGPEDFIDSTTPLVEGKTYTLWLVLKSTDCEFEAEDALFYPAKNVALQNVEMTSGSCSVMTESYDYAEKGKVLSIKIVFTAKSSSTPGPNPPKPTPDPKPTPNPNPNPTPSSDPTQSDIPVKEPEEPLLRSYNGNKTIAKAGKNDNEAESEIGGICYMLQQGPLCNAAFAAATPTGFKEAFTFNFSLDTSIYHKTNYDRKRGLFVLNIPKAYQKKGRTFRIIGINKNGQTKVFSDSDMDDDTFTTTLDVEGYAFSLIYTDSTVKTEKAVTKGSSSSQNDNIYTVKSGDTLSAIARRLGVNLRKLIDRNDLDDPDKLSIGQKISY